MAVANVNGVHLYYERIGSGEPLVLVHGSWGDHLVWAALVPLLAERFDVVSYDRRGHSESERPTSQGSVHEDAEDLAQLIASLDLAPAHVVANSYGGLIAMRLAVARPELVRSLNVHEPPGAALLADDPGSAAMLQQLGQSIAQVTAKLEAGEHEAAAKQFADEIAFGPGAWENEMSPEMRTIMVNNAPTFLDETRDPEALGVDVEGLKSFERPFLLTDGDQSPPMYAAVIARVTAAVPNVEHRTIAGVAHVPQVTHPDLYADIVGDFADAA